MSIKATFKLQHPIGKGDWGKAFRDIERMVNNGELDPAKPYVLYFTTGKVVRTRSQNNYYWGVVVQTFADAVGMEADEVHDIWKRAFAGYRMVDFPGGKRRRVSNSTASMSKEDMSKYMEKCIGFCAENGVVIPNPDALTSEQHVDLVSRGVLKA